MKKTFAIFLLICSLSISYAQKTTTKTVLSTALKDDRLTRNQQLITLAQGLKFNIPIIKEVQLRLGINGSVLDDTIYGYVRNEDVYGLQLSTNSFREIRQQNMYSNKTCFTSINALIWTLWLFCTNTDNKSMFLTLDKC